MAQKGTNALRNIVRVTISNLATIIAGIIVGLIIPKVMPVDGYGYYKTFTLYVSYAGFFSLGIIDGVVLQFGGYNYDELDQKKFRSIFKWYLLVHLISDAVLIILAIFNRNNEYGFLLFMIALYITFNNLVGYFQQISQITQRFKEYSVAKMIQSLLKVVGGLIMMAVYYLTKELVDYRIYVALLTSGLAVVSIGYFYIYKRIVFGEADTLATTRPTILFLSSTGFPLMFANLCATLILTLDRQFVNILFPTTEYAIYAFAYNLLSLITVATSAISTVLYPVLKRTTEDTLKENYSNLISTILIFVFGALISYFPLCAFIEWFLPKYADSLIIFRVIFPGLAISSAVTVVMHNYYKTLGDNLKYFKKSVLILVVSATANGIAYLIFKTTVSISVASIVTMFIWYIYIEQYFVTNYKYSRWRNLIYLIVAMSIFYLATIIDNWIISGLLYCVLYTSLTILVQRDALQYIPNFLGR